MPTYSCAYFCFWTGFFIHPYIFLRIFVFFYWVFYSPLHILAVCIDLCFCNGSCWHLTLLSLLRMCYFPQFLHVTQIIMDLCEFLWTFLHFDFCRISVNSSPHLSIWDFTGFVSISTFVRLGICRIWVNFCAHLCVWGWDWGRAAAFPNFPPRIFCPQCQNVGGKLGWGLGSGGKCLHVFSNEISRFMGTSGPRSIEIKSKSKNVKKCNRCQHVFSNEFMRT